VLFVPPLRDRISDLPILVEGLLRRLKPEIGERMLTREGHFRLADHEWPGNVRELLHVLQRAAVMSDAQVLDDAEIVAALADDPVLDAPPVPASATKLSPPTDAAIRSALQVSNGSIKGAAKLLGIARSTLRDRLARSKCKPD
jgi:DNA-binding NtrC family response regulator